MGYENAQGAFYYNNNKRGCQNSSSKVNSDNSTFFTFIAVTPYAYPLALQAHYVGFALSLLIKLNNGKANPLLRL